MEWIEDVFYGAVTKGVNDTTVNLFRIACVGCIISLAALAGVSYKTRPDIIPHCIFALVLACALFGIFTWMMSQLGTITPAEQLGELTGRKPAVDETTTETVTVAPKPQAVKKAE